MDGGIFWKDGTWDVYFGSGLKAPITDRVGLAIVGLKHELVYNGVPVGGMNLDVPEIGSGTVNAIKKFQTAQGNLEVDGVVGPNTAKALLRKRGRAEAKRVGAPIALICQQFDLESACDLACLSKNGQDRGPSQINEMYHPSVTAEKAFDPAFCIPWQASYLRSGYDAVLTVDGGHDWDLALAAYNVGTAGARKWEQAGRPSTNPDGSVNTAYAYVRAVHSRSG